LGGAFYNTNGILIIGDCNVSSNVCQGLSQYGTGLAMGGAAFQTSGSLAIDNSIFSLNRAVGGNGLGAPNAAPASPAYGGGVAATGGSVTIDNSQFFANTAKGGAGGYHGAAGPAFGGAVYSMASLTVRDSSFFGNQTFAGIGTTVPQGGSKGADGCGSAIYNSGTTVLNRCSVCSNYLQGGSAYAYPGFSGNGGNGLGGGIFNAAQLAATNCTIALNSAVGGNGEEGFTSSVANGGQAIGGGVFNNTNATFVAMNLTIASNNCSSPSGVGFTNGLAAGDEIANTSGTLRLHNSLIAYGTNCNAYGPTTDDGYNISSDGTANLNSGSSFNYTDPQLAPLANYGGPTLCMALLPTSPAIDSGDPVNFPSTDQRGYVRPFGSGPDMGAYEFGATQPGALQLNIAPTTGSVVLSFLTSVPGLYHLQASTNLTVWSDLNTYGPFAGATNISQTISRQAFNALYFRLKVQ
jgi:hypothetical protein